MRPSQFTATITKGLGYCCPWSFFTLFHDNEAIAARLGFSSRTVRRYRLTQGECANCPGCIKPQIALAVAQLKKRKET